MPNYSLEHPVLNVAIGGAAAERRPSSFSLVTDDGFPSVMARLRFPADEPTGKQGDPVIVNMAVDTDEYLLFTGEIYSAGVRGRYHELALTDGYKKLCDTNLIAAYRKENAGVILHDTLQSAGIKKTDITCPAVGISRFSTKEIPAEHIITLLIKALEEHGHMGLRFFFDACNTFRFGTAKNSGKNEGTVFAFESGKNILKKGDGWIEVLPLPIRHTQEITVDGTTLIPKRTELIVSGNHSRLRLWLGEAA